MHLPFRIGTDDPPRSLHTDVQFLTAPSQQLLARSWEGAVKNCIRLFVEYSDDPSFRIFVFNAKNRQNGHAYWK